MAEKINLDSDLRTVIKPGDGNIVPNLIGVWSDTNLLCTRAREHIRPPVSDLRMVVRVQRKNKHPHSTKKHK
jgi:hypothetical protein